jgi:hypothetical protein
MRSPHTAPSLKLDVHQTAEQMRYIAWSSMHLVRELCPLLEAVVELPPMPCAVVHLSVPIQLLQLEDWSCTHQQRIFVRLHGDSIRILMEKAHGSLPQLSWQAHHAMLQLLTAHNSRTIGRRNA